MNLHKVIDSNKLYDLYNQIFDYFSLTIYDLESKLDTNLSIEKFKKQLETFSDNHFKSALNEFNCEILKLKDQIPDDFTKIEKLSNDLKIYFNSFLERNLSITEVLSLGYKSSIFPEPVSNISVITF